MKESEKYAVDSDSYPQRVSLVKALIEESSAPHLFRGTLNTHAEEREEEIWYLACGAFKIQLDISVKECTCYTEEVGQESKDQTYSQHAETVAAASVQKSICIFFRQDVAGL